MHARREQIARLGRVIALRHREITAVIARETCKPVTEAASQEVTAARARILMRLLSAFPFKLGKKTETEPRA